MRGLTAEEAALLFKLYRRGVFGKHHMLEDNALQGFPSDRVGAMRVALNQLKRDGILVQKASGHGRAVSIPPSLGAELYEELRKRYPWLPR